MLFTGICEIGLQPALGPDHLYIFNHVWNSLTGDEELLWRDPWIDRSPSMDGITSV